jgi:hypothetical protein
MMRKKLRVGIVIALYVGFILSYVLFFVLGIENIPLFLILTIGSVTILSTSTIYTVIHSDVNQEVRIRKKKLAPKQPMKSIKKKTTKVIDDYIEAMPLIEEYIESNESFEDLPVIQKFIFSEFSQEELDKINLMDLSKTDKILFIREMLYFDANERITLIEEMLKNKDKTEEEIIYSPPTNPIELEDQIRIYLRSLVEPGEKTKIIIIYTTELISELKERVSVLFDYNLEDFLLSSGGILLNEDLRVKDYDIETDNEIALIPSRKK